MTLSANEIKVVAATIFPAPSRRRVAAFRTGGFHSRSRPGSHSCLHFQVQNKVKEVKSLAQNYVTGGRVALQARSPCLPRRSFLHGAKEAICCNDGLGCTARRAAAGPQRLPPGPG